MKNKSINLLAISLSGAVAATALVGSFSASQAAVTVFTDRSLWEAAVGSFSLEEFNTNSDPAVIDNFTINSDSPLNNVSDGVYHNRLTPTDSTTFTYNVGSLTAFGADWNLAGPGGVGIGIDVTLLDGTIVSAGSIDQNTGGAGFEFWGIVSDDPFESVLLDGGTQSGSAETYDLDNLSYAGSQDAPSTPESSTVIGLLAVGLLGVTSRRLRK